MSVADGETTLGPAGIKLIRCPPRSSIGVNCFAAENFAGSAPIAASPTCEPPVFDEEPVLVTELVLVAATGIETIGRST